MDTTNTARAADLFASAKRLTHQAESEERCSMFENAATLRHAALVNLRLALALRETPPRKRPTMTSKIDLTKTRRATQNGEEIEEYCHWADIDVPSYVAGDGVSINAAAKSLGMRVLPDSDRVTVPVAEIHERGVYGSWWLVPIEVAP